MNAIEYYIKQYKLELDDKLFEIAILDVEGFPVKDEWYLCYPKGKQLSVVAQVFAEYMTFEGRELTVETLPEGINFDGQTLVIDPMKF